jgi:hypothetical protein
MAGDLCLTFVSKGSGGRGKRKWRDWSVIHDSILDISQAVWHIFIERLENGWWTLTLQ